MVNAKLLAITGVVTITAIAVLAAVYKSGGGSTAYKTVGDICADVKDPSDEIQALCMDTKDIGVFEPIFCGSPDFEVVGVDDDAGLMAAASASAPAGVAIRTISCSEDADYCDGGDEKNPEHVEVFRRFCQKTCNSAPVPLDMTFTMDEILSASDVNAKFEEVVERCGQASGDRRLEEIEEKFIARKAERILSNKKTNLREMMETKSEKNVARRLVVDHGWCSTNLGFIVGASADSADYCNPTQTCDSYGGGCSYKGDLLAEMTECCVVHDKCLESDPNLPNAGERLKICAQQDCRGQTCDVNLGECAWKDRHCHYVWFVDWLGNTWYGYDLQCAALKTALWGIMGKAVQPQASWNTGGKDTTGCCKASERGNMNCGGTPLDWGSHGQRPHDHNPHDHNPHGHNPHGHNPHGHRPGGWW